jgi:hypothetical protein
MAFGYPTEDDTFDEDEQRQLQSNIESQQGEQPVLAKGYQLPPGMTLDKPAGPTPEAYQPLERTSSGIQAKLPSGMVLDNKPTYQLPEGMTLDKPVAGADQAAPPEYQTSYTGALYPNIAQQRQQWVHEIESNPRLRQYAAAAMSLEAGDDVAYLGAVESLFNRTQQRRSRISKELTNGFYGPVNRGEVDARIKRGMEPWMYEKFDRALEAVKNGSDLIEGRTDQGMRNEIIGPRAKYGSEYFGYMGGDPSWSMQHQRNKGEPGTATRGPVKSYDVSGKLIPLGGERGPDTSRALLPPGMVLDKPQQVGLDAITAESKEAGLTVTSGYRDPSHPLSRANPQSAHTQGRAFDLRAQTGDEADQVMAAKGDLPREDWKKVKTISSLMR